MRTEERWNKIKEARAAQLFPPRVCRDLQLYPDGGVKMSTRFVTGAAGTGKTVYAANCMIGQMRLDYLANQHYTYLFINFPELINQMRESFNAVEGKESAGDLLRKLQTVDYLILDDLGVDQMTPWVYSQIYLIINSRYENLRTTLIVSNLSLQELATAWGDTRITSRIERMGVVAKKEKYKQTPVIQK